MYIIVTVPCAILCLIGLIAIGGMYYNSKNKTVDQICNHPDVYKVCGDAKALYDHSTTYGIKEGRQSSAQFSILVYKENNQDLVDVFGDDIIKYYNHFIEYGVNEDRVAK